MDEARLEQLAEAATSDYWPPHLLAPDEDKVYLLGEALKEAVDIVTARDEQADEAASEIEALRQQIDDIETDFEQRIEDLRDRLDKLEREA